MPVECGDDNDANSVQYCSILKATSYVAYRMWVKNYLKRLLQTRPTALQELMSSEDLTNEGAHLLEIVWT